MNSEVHTTKSCFCTKLLKNTVWSLFQAECWRCLVRHGWILCFDWVSSPKYLIIYLQIFQIFKSSQHLKHFWLWAFWARDISLSSPSPTSTVSTNNQAFWYLPGLAEKWLFAILVNIGLDDAEVGESFPVVDIFPQRNYIQAGRPSTQTANVARGTLDPRLAL